MFLINIFKFNFESELEKNNLRGLKPTLFLTKLIFNPQNNTVHPPFNLIAFNFSLLMPNLDSLLMRSLCPLTIFIFLIQPPQFYWSPKSNPFSSANLISHKPNISSKCGPTKPHTFLSQTNVALVLYALRLECSP